METEIVRPDSPLMAGAFALGAVSAMVATLLLFPLIDRFLRPRFELERGSAMLLLLGLSLAVGLISGVLGYSWLEARELERLNAAPAISTEHRSGEAPVPGL